MVSLRINKKQLIFDLSGYSLQRMKNLRIRVNAKRDLENGGKKLFYVETRQQKTIIRRLLLFYVLPSELAKWIIGPVGRRLIQ